jgi:circadian clock protein KaiC
MERAQSSEELVGTGIPGLDDILHGGLSPNTVYLVEGTAGAGKTTLGLHFLSEGVRLGEPVLQVTLSESADELRRSARAHGWSLDGIEILELIHFDTGPLLETQYTMFHPSEVEMVDLTRRIFEEVERIGARRVVLDSLAEIRLVAQNPLWFRRQLLALKQYFSGSQCTVLLLDESAKGGEHHARTVVHGVLTLEQMPPEYGGDRRRLRVEKLRGKNFLSGYHDFTIVLGGLRVFPRLVAQEHGEAPHQEDVSSGLPQLDALTGGGIPAGSCTLIIGPSGTGKSSVAAQYLVNFAQGGGKGAVFLFDESIKMFQKRAQGMGMDCASLQACGRISILQIDPAELSPGEFAAAVRTAVEEGAQMVVIDSLSGYHHAMPGERFLMLHMHELLSYLGQRGVTTLMIVTQHGLLSADIQTPVDVSYIADSVIVLRFFEAEGVVRKAISVAKKRTGNHERTIRELQLGPGGLHIGPPLRRFRGVLTGTPSGTGRAACRPKEP